MHSDKTDIDEITGMFFGAFTNGGGAPSDIECLYQLFLPECVIVGIGAGTAKVYDLAGFIEPRRALLSDGTPSGPVAIANRGSPPDARARVPA